MSDKRDMLDEGLETLAELALEELRTEMHNAFIEAEKANPHGALQAILDYGHEIALYLFPQDGSIDDIPRDHKYGRYEKHILRYFIAKGIAEVLVNYNGERPKLPGERIEAMINDAIIDKTQEYSEISRLAGELAKEKRIDMINELFEHIKTL